MSALSAQFVYLCHGFTAIIIFFNSFSSGPSLDKLMDKLMDKQNIPMYII